MQKTPKAHSGKGATPEYALNSVLKSNGLDPEKDVTIEYKSEHAEVVAALAEDQTAVGLLPQPFVTTALMKNENLRVALYHWHRSFFPLNHLQTGWNHHSPPDKEHQEYLLPER